MSTPIPSHSSANTSGFISSTSSYGTTASSNNVTTKLPPLTQHRRHGSTGQMVIAPNNAFVATASSTSSMNNHLYYSPYTPRPGCPVNAYRAAQMAYIGKLATSYVPVVTTVGHTSVSTLLPSSSTSTAAVLQRSYDNLSIHSTTLSSVSQPIDCNTSVDLFMGEEHCGAEECSDWGEGEAQLGSPIPLPCLEGPLNKWTNLLHGWQERYFVLTEGALSYYKSKEEQKLGCRGSLRLANAIVRPHEYDDCRFEVRVGDNIWYLRCHSLSERHTWIQGLECHRIADAEPHAVSTFHQLLPHMTTASTAENSMGGLVSLPSTASHSLASTSSFQRGHRLKEKLAEMETFKDILCKQVDTLQTYFDSCSQLVRQGRHHQACSSANMADSLLELPEEPSGWETERDAAFSQTRPSKEAAEEYSLQRNRTPTHSPMKNITLPRSQSASPVISTAVMDDGAGEAANPVATLLYDNDLHHRSSNEIETSKEEVSEGPVSSGAVGTMQNQTAQRGLLSRWFTFRSNPATTNVQTVEDVSSASLGTEVCDVPSASEGKGMLPVYYTDLQRVLMQHGSHAPDFRGEAITFKATTMGILATLSHCIDLLLQSEDQSRKRMELEREKRRRLEESYRVKIAELQEDLRQQRELTASLQRQLETCLRNGTITSPITSSGEAGSGGKLYPLVGSPDMEEGPNCAIGEEEFFDALDAQLDKLEMQEEMLEALRAAGQSLSTTKSPMTSSHPLYDEVQRIVQEHLVLCDPTRVTRLSEEPGWQMIARDGDMRIYKRELESSDGKVLDPLQATHVIHGITGRELCHYFWDVKYRMEWEFTVDQPPTVIEVCGDDTLLLHQVYKRVWPTSQRDAVFWSHMRRVSAGELRTALRSGASELNCGPLAEVIDEDASYWMVMNYSTDYKAPDLSKLPNQMIRLTLDVVMIGQTLRRDAERPWSRDNVSCRLLYAASIDPGGWAPASVLRKLAQREYPRFVKQFSQFVVDKTKDLPLLL